MKQQPLASKALDVFWIQQHFQLHRPEKLQLHTATTDAKPPTETKATAAIKPTSKLQKCLPITYPLRLQQLYTVITLTNPITETFFRMLPYILRGHYSNVCPGTDFTPDAPPDATLPIIHAWDRPWEHTEYPMRLALCLLPGRSQEALMCKANVLTTAPQSHYLSISWQTKFPSGEHIQPFICNRDRWNKTR